MTDTSEASNELLSLTADIVAAHVSNNSVAVSDLPGLIASIHASLSGLGSPISAAEAPQEPAVSVRSSIRPDYIVCLEDGKKLKMLKRHLMTHYQMTPEQYRSKWKLASDYPMVAPNYAKQRRALAHKIGLGRKPTTSAAASPALASPAAKPAAAKPAPVAKPAATQSAAAAAAKPAPAKKAAATKEPAAAKKPAAANKADAPKSGAAPKAAAPKKTDTAKKAGAKPAEVKTEAKKPAKAKAPAAEKKPQARKPRSDESKTRSDAPKAKSDAPAKSDTPKS